MANLTNEKLAEIINLIASDEGEQKPKENKEEKSREEIAAEVRAEIEAEIKEAAKKKMEQQNSDNSEEEEDNDSEDKNLVRENRYITKGLKSGLASSGISDDVIDSIAEFIDYDKLKENEEASDDKISELVESISKVAKRTPPKGEKRVNLSDDGGLSKYLPKK